uniref:FORGETTER1 first zinc ribbon domain-containing protein n=1 Tax=Chenopodium quinoa TaxID=63459 RepID=A0A803L291_CHEQI
MAQISSQPSVTPTQLQPSSIRCYGCHRILAVIPHLMVFRCPACLLQHRLLPPQGPLSCIGPREVAPSEFQRFAHKMCYSGMETDADDVKPSILERTTNTSIVSLKDNKLLKEVEEVEDCFILDFDPYESEFSSPSTLLVDDDDLIIVGEQGECYCYVCDVPAPCEQWTKQSTYFTHCEAVPDNQIWTDLRISKRRKIYASFDECYLQDTSICHEVDQ